MTLGCIHNLANKCLDINDYQNLYKKINKYKYISFDIFDTLIKRDVPEPTDIFNIVGDRAGIVNFKDKRIKAELAARQDKGMPEVNLNDIYDKLSYIPNYTSIKQLECQIEIEECVPNKDIYDLFNYCVQHKKVVIITDMYLPRVTIETILKKNKFEGYELLVISNEEQLVKSDGRLFERALDIGKINAHELIHIGNSTKSDYFGAKRARIDSVKIPTFKNRIKKNLKYMFSDETKHDYLMSFINNHIDLSSPYYNFGYQSFGPLLYGFVTWLRNDLRKNHFDHVLFMSRDGYIIKRIYDQICDENDVPSQYFEVSRRSLRVPTYNNSMSYFDMLNVLTVPKLTNPEQILDSWGLNFKKYSQKLLNLGFESNTSIKRDSLLNDDKFKRLFETIKNDIWDNSTEELITLKSYLKQFDFSKKTAIVDIGWGGSMQYFLIKTLKKMKIENDISGYYIGLTHKSIENLKLNGLNAKGYAFDAMNNGDTDMERPFVGLFETLFLEQSGSVKRYKVNNGQIQVVRYPYEYINAGKKGKEIRRVKLIQDGAIRFNLDFYNSCTARYIGFDNKTMFSNLYKIGTNPSLNDVKLFGDFEFFNNGTKVYLASPKPFIYYIMHLKALRKDLYDSQWKIGFLKGLLKLKINYKAFFNILRKATN